jgi:hypothetical protein
VDTVVIHDPAEHVGVTHAGAKENGPHSRGEFPAGGPFSQVLLQVP